MTPELAGAFYIIIGLSVALIILAVAGFKLWRDIAVLEVRQSMSEQDYYGTLSDLRSIRIDIRADEKRLSVVENGVTDLAQHADLVTQWINLATDKFEAKK